MQAQSTLQSCLDMVDTQIEAMEYLHNRLLDSSETPPLYLVEDVIDAQLALARSLSQDRPPLRLLVDEEGAAVSARLVALYAQMDMMVVPALLADTVLLLLGDLRAMGMRLRTLAAS